MADSVAPLQKAPEWVGPDGSREDVSAVSDRALVLRAVHEALCTRHDLGALVRELALVRRKVDRGEEEITLVRDLRKALASVRRTMWKRTVGAFFAVMVILMAAYLAGKLGLHAP